MTVSPESGPTTTPRSEGVPLSDLEVVLVTFHSRGLVEELFAALPEELPVVIVDNGRGADGIDALAATRPNTRYLDGGGVGFARAANKGARSSTRPFVVFVNPDTRPQVEQLLALAQDLAEDASLAAVAATTVTPDGRVELGVGGWEPTPRRVFVYATGLHAVLPTAGVFARPKPHQPIELEWLTGACLAVPRETFLALGGFDESFFLYNEDMAYGRRLREAGYRLRLRTDILVPHAGGGSGGGKARMLQMRGASSHAYAVRHNGWFDAQVMRLIYTAGAFGRWAVCRGRGRPEAAAGFAAYIKGLWRGAPDMS